MQVPSTVIRRPKTECRPRTWNIAVRGQGAVLLRLTSGAALKQAPLFRIPQPRLVQRARNPGWGRWAEKMPIRVGLVQRCQ